MKTNTIEFEVADHVATITLNRPDQLNSFNNEMGAEMSWAWETVRDTDDIHVAIIRANGDRAFSTGMDISETQSWFSKDNVWNTYDPGCSLSPKQYHKVWKPVITAVHGMCAGGGQYFINEADIVICSDDATFFDPHVNAGITSSLEPIGMLARGVPLGDVLRWALLGTEERITAETALRLGLVTEITTREELWSRADELAAEIASRATIPIQGTVRAIWESLELTRSMALQNGMAYTHIGNADVGEEFYSKDRVNKKPRFR